MTVLTGEAAAHAQEMTDKAVVDMCMAILQKLFPFKVKRVHFTFMHGEEKLREILTKGNCYVNYPNAAKKKSSSELTADFQVPLCLQLRYCTTAH